MGDGMRDPQDLMEKIDALHIQEVDQILRVNIIVCILAGIQKTLEKEVKYLSMSANSLQPLRSTSPFGGGLILKSVVP